MSIFNKLKEIKEGWVNYAAEKLKLLPDNIKEQAAERIEECNSCELNKMGLCNSMKKGEHRHTGLEVSGCGCVLKAKVLSPTSSCPLGKWDEMITEKSKYDIFVELTKKNHVYVRMNGEPQMLYRNPKDNYFVSKNGRIKINERGLVLNHYKDISKSFIVKYYKPQSVPDDASASEKVFALLEQVWKKLNDIQKDGIYFCILSDVPNEASSEVQQGLIKWIAENKHKSPILNIIIENDTEKIKGTAGVYDKNLDHYDY